MRRLNYWIHVKITFVKLSRNRLNNLWISILGILTLSKNLNKLKVKLIDTEIYPCWFNPSFFNPSWLNYYNMIFNRQKNCLVDYQKSVSIWTNMHIGSLSLILRQIFGKLILQLRSILMIFCYRLSLIKKFCKINDSHWLRIIN
jgi:hypothetical protein